MLYLITFCPQGKLEEAFSLATDFQNSLQDFINWLTQAEQSLNVAPQPSLILDTVLFQIDEHKVRSLKPISGLKQSKFPPATSL